MSNETYNFECDYCGCIRHYKTLTQAKQAAKRHVKKHDKECVRVMVEVIKTTFNPYTKTKIE